MNNILHVGVDVGSTTVKIVVLDSELNVLFEDYKRHYSDTNNTICSGVEDLIQK